MAASALRYLRISRFRSSISCCGECRLLRRGRQVICLDLLAPLLLAQASQTSLYDKEATANSTTRARVQRRLYRSANVPACQRRSTFAAEPVIRPTDAGARPRPRPPNDPHATEYARRTNDLRSDVRCKSHIKPSRPSTLASI
jgi:hypothetical protein